MRRKVILILASVSLAVATVGAFIYTQYLKQPSQGTIVFQKTYIFQQSSCYPSCNATQHFNFPNGTIIALNAEINGGIAVSFSAADSNGRPSFPSYINTPPRFSNTWTINISDNLQSQILFLFDQDGYSGNATITIRKT